MNKKLTQIKKEILKNLVDFKKFKKDFKILKKFIKH